MMTIEVFGLGCENCSRLESNVRKAVDELGIVAEVVRVEDFEVLIRRGVKSTPGLAIDGRIASMGRVPSVDQIKEMLGKGSDLKSVTEIKILSSANGCGCATTGMIIYPCSGGSNVSQISNEAAKILVSKGAGKFSCLVGIGAHGKGFIDSARKAQKVVVIDGCGVQCALKTLQHVEIEPSLHVIVTDMGVKKDYVELNPRREDVEAVVRLIEG
jgi:small redox-active disulfide protein 2